jgi:competence protein ComEC
MTLVQNRLAALSAMRGQLMPWAPVFLAIGIGAYFGLPVEPGLAALAAALAATAALLLLAWRGPDDWRPLAMALALVAGGLLIASLRSHMVAGPVLSFRYYGPVQGRIVDIDRSFSDQPRLTLDQVVLRDVDRARTPLRVRISLHGDQGQFLPHPGMTVMLTANLSPPDGPVEPGGFDFQRYAWFSQVGAVGYTRTPTMELEPAEGGLALMAFRLRMLISGAMQARMTGQPGVTAATTEALRGSNLSHMISISGLHMGLLTGFVFGLCRYGLALVPYLALRVNSKKIAAVVALLAATFYMILAGPEVAVRRSYIMAAVMLLAVLADRRAISLRSVAISALICLALEPESLVEPGFQMSFGATTALIVGFEYWAKVQHRVPALLRPVAMAVMSSLIAGTATAPIAAAHFNRIAEYGLLANLLAVPVMGMVVMPAGVLAAILAPLGLAEPALWVMDQGCAAILWIADWVAGLHGSVVPVPAPPRMVLPLVGLFGATAMIARGRVGRVGGLIGLALTIGSWSLAPRPVVLVAADGGMVGVMTDAGRVLSKEKGGGFVVKNWLENDGDTADQPTAFQRAGFVGNKGAMAATVEGRPVRVFFGKGSGERAKGACSDDAILVLNEAWIGDGPADRCQVFDLTYLRANGAVALFDLHKAMRIVTARAVAGDRLWNHRPAPRKARLAAATAPNP